MASKTEGQNVSMFENLPFLVVIVIVFFQGPSQGMLQMEHLWSGRVVLVLLLCVTPSLSQSRFDGNGNRT